MNPYEKKTELYREMSKSICNYLRASVYINDVPNDFVNMRSVELRRLIEMIDITVSQIRRLLKEN